MPTVFVDHGYSFRFKSYDSLNEPIHIHVYKERKNAKFWIKDETYGLKDKEANFWIRDSHLVVNNGFALHEINEIRDIIQQRKEEIINEWKTRS